MNSWDDTSYNWGPLPPPGTPEYPEPKPQRDPLEGRYEPWTRKPLFYWPILIRGEFVGYIWASQHHKSAGLVRISSRDDYLWMDVWRERLDDSCKQGLRPVDAVQRWVGAPEDPVGGYLPADAPVYDAPNLDTLHQRTNPGGPPAPGPFIQDGEFPDGTPVDRSEGWGPLISAPLRRYATSTSSAVRYLPIVKEGRHIGYLWASVDNDAADYLPLRTAGKTAQVAAGLWQLRLSQGYKQHIPPLQVLEDNRRHPEDHLSGMIQPGAHEGELPSLEHLEALAQR